MNNIGYHVCYELLNAKDYYVPPHRERWYVIGFLVSATPINQAMDTYNPPSWSHNFKLFLTNLRHDEPFDLRTFLLDDKNPAVLECIQERRQAMENRRSQRKSSQGVPDYEVDHLVMFQEAGMSWPPDYTTDEALYNAISFLLYKWVLGNIAN